ncbi:MAG: peptidase U32 family protein [Vicingaceae bacterium]
MELMAPAGSFEALQAAIQSGADSVYFGVEQLNMRAKSSINFTLDDLPEIAMRCEKAGIKSYLTLNTIIYDHDLSIIKTLTNKVKEAGITAIIASDQAVINYAKSAGVEIHISTQVNVTNLETVKFYANFADVMVLSRELSLRQVKAITDGVKREKILGPSGELVQIEIFGHGALCMAVSGKCYLSLHTHNSSANRGACIQNCRRTYTVIDKEEGYELEIDNEYIMSPKDLCTIDFLDQVMATGVSVLKIEGRGRAPEYVYTTVKVYREAIDSILDGSYSEEKVAGWMDQLNKVYNRGFWSGYYLGQKLGEWSKKHGSQATEKKVYLGKGMHYFPRPKIGQFRMEALTLNVGDQILITGPTTGVIQTEVSELMVNDRKVESTVKGEDFTMPIGDIIRPSDKLYKIVAS